MTSKVNVDTNGIGFFPFLDIKHGFSWKNWGNMSDKWEEDTTKSLVKIRIENFLKELEMNPLKNGLTINGEGDYCFDIGSLEGITEEAVDADSAFTLLSGIPIMQKPADCIVSVFSAFDRDGKHIIGLSHAGRSQIGRKRPVEHIKHLIDHYGCDVSKIQIGIVPSLMSEHHKIKFEDKEKILGGLENWGEFVTKNDNERVYHVDNLGFILKQYTDSGVLEGNIFAYTVDTYNSAKEGSGFSHRYSVENNLPNGRFLVVAQL